MEMKLIKQKPIIRKSSGLSDKFAELMADALNTNVKSAKKRFNLK